MPIYGEICHLSSHIELKIGQIYLICLPHALHVCCVLEEELVVLGTIPILLFEGPVTYRITVALVILSTIDQEAFVVPQQVPFSLCIEHLL